jgi:aspartate/glutamate/glutamine transport system permease protein
MNGPLALFKWQALFKDWSVFAEGFLITALVAVLALLLAVTIGIVLGVLGASQTRGARFLSRVYVELFQNTPLVIQIFFLYNGLPKIGIVLPVFLVGVLGVGMYHGAYIAEVIRGGILAIPKGQKEAAASQGFSYWVSMRYIVLPQAKLIIYPPMTNQAVFLIKNTSVMAMIAGGDLLYQADSWSSSNLYYGPSFIVTGILYFLLCFPLAQYARTLEKRAEAHR